MGGADVWCRQPVCNQASGLKLVKMANDEAPMTKEIRSPNDEVRSWH